MIGPKTTLAELEITLGAFGLALEVRLTPNADAHTAIVSDEDYTEAAIGSTLAEAIDTAIENWKVARTLGNAAVMR